MYFKRESNDYVYVYNLVQQESNDYVLGPHNLDSLVKTLVLNFGQSRLKRILDNLGRFMFYLSHNVDRQ